MRLYAFGVKNALKFVILILGSPNRVPAAATLAKAGRT